PAASDRCFAASPSSPSVQGPGSTRDRFGHSQRGKNRTRWPRCATAAVSDRQPESASRREQPHPTFSGCPLSIAGAWQGPHVEDTQEWPKRSAFVPQVAIVADSYSFPL